MRTKKTVMDDIVHYLQDLLDGPIPMTLTRQDVRQIIDEITHLREKIQDLYMYAEQDSCEIERLRDKIKSQTNTL